MADDATEELRAAHDVLAEIYAERLVGHYESMPVEQAVLGVWAALVAQGGTVGDIGCGTGRLAPHLTAFGLTVRGVDLSPEMVRVAQRDQPGLDVRVGDLRALPFGDGELDGAVAWYSLMYLPPEARPDAFAELARVLRPGSPLAVAWKQGDDAPRRGGAVFDVGFDIWWHSRDELEQRLTAAGFEVRMWVEKPADPDEQQDQGYVVAVRGTLDR